MALADTGLAVGSVSRFLESLLTSALSNVPPYHTVITVQRPQPDPPNGNTAAHARLNLFLYEMELDAAMRNVPLTPGVPAPLWVVLRYVMTAFDLAGESDTADSHDVLGMGMQVLLGINDLLPDVGPYNALVNNPEPLKLTFNQGTPELLSRLMQGPDDKYRCSIAFEVRPVLIAQAVPPVGMQLVGVNYLLGTTIGLKGVQNFVLPSLGPKLESVEPAQVELGDTLTLSGSGLNEPGISVQLGSATLTPNSQKLDTLTIPVSGIDSTTTSSGNIPVSISQTLSNGHSITSNVASVALLPSVSTITIHAIAAASSNPQTVYGTISLTGKLLGGPNDYVEFALSRNGVVALLLDTPDASFVPPGDQTAQQFTFPSTSAIPAGTYFAIFRVNGQQAKQPFTLNMVAP